MEYNVNYDFYIEYFTENSEFKNKFEERKKMIIEKYKLKNQNLDFILREYFVELFSWSVFPKKILEKVVEYVRENEITGIIDPCCGNAFHTYLFGNISKLNTFTVDIQDEPCSWNSIQEMEGRAFMRQLLSQEHESNALLLSWIDYESLTMDLLNAYKGKMVISVGNYDKLSPNYVEQLRAEYKLLEQFILKMPWGLTEKIEVYLR